MWTQLDCRISLSNLHAADGPSCLSCACMSLPSAGELTPLENYSRFASSIVELAVVMISQYVGLTYKTCLPFLVDRSFSRTHTSYRRLEPTSRFIYIIPNFKKNIKEMRFFSPFRWVSLILAMLPTAISSPMIHKRANGVHMGLNTDFPDPSFLQATDGKWYAFGTNGNGKRIQVASSSDFNTWTLLDIEALPTLSTWETDKDHYAPDVIQRVSSIQNSFQTQPQLNSTRAMEST